MKVFQGIKIHSVALHNYCKCMHSLNIFSNPNVQYLYKTIHKIRTSFKDRFKI